MWLFHFVFSIDFNNVSFRIHWSMQLVHNAMPMMCLVWFWGIGLSQSQQQFWNLFTFFLLIVMKPIIHVIVKLGSGVPVTTNLAVRQSSLSLACGFGCPERVWGAASRSALDLSPWSECPSLIFRGALPYALDLPKGAGQRPTAPLGEALRG